MKSRAFTLTIVLLFLAITPAFADTQLVLCIMATVTSGGSMTPSGAVEVAYGSSQTFYITPDDEYYTKEVQIDGYTLPIAPTTYTFANVTTSHKIHVVFEVKISDNHPPVAKDQVVMTYINTPVNIVINAIDDDNDILVYTVVSDPSHGTLSGAVPNLVYTPESDYVGTDGFQFQASDGKAGDTGSVIIEVQDAPHRVTVKLAFAPVLVESEGGVQCTAEATCDQKGCGIETYTWVAFWISSILVFPNNAVQNPVWIAPANMYGVEMGILFTCKVACNGGGAGYSTIAVPQVRIKPDYADMVQRLINLVNAQQGIKNTVPFIASLNNVKNAVTKETEEKNEPLSEQKKTVAGNNLNAFIKKVAEQVKDETAATILINDAKELKKLIGIEDAK